MWENLGNFFLMNVDICPLPSLLAYLLYALAMDSAQDSKAFESRKCQNWDRLGHGPPQWVLGRVTWWSLNTGQTAIIKAEPNCWNQIILAKATQAGDFKGFWAVSERQFLCSNCPSEIWFLRHSPTKLSLRSHISFHFQQCQGYSELHKY